jgi:hypothetical protein
MAYQSEDFQKFSKQHLEALSSSSSIVSKNWKVIADESAEYSKKSLENSSVFFEKLLGAKSFDGAIRIQVEFAKSFFDDHVAYMTKLTELYSKLAKDAFAPVGTAITKVQAFKE